MSKKKFVRPRTLAIDIGGSGCKALVLDHEGNPVTERTRIKTPEKPTPKAVMAVLDELTQLQDDFDRISVGFPGVVVNGKIYTAVNLHPDWVGFNLAKALKKLTGRPTRVANDADIQGLGVIEGVGVEMVITLGTGMGASLFTNGYLVPNLELGHHPFRKGKTYEELVCETELKSIGRKEWSKRVADVVEVLNRIFNYRMLYLGGGNAKKIELELPPNVKRVLNVTGLLGGIALWQQ